MKRRHSLRGTFLLAAVAACGGGAPPLDAHDDATDAGDGVGARADDAGTQRGAVYTPRAAGNGQRDQKR